MMRRKDKPKHLSARPLISKEFGVGSLPSAVWETERWPNFSSSELACRHCGEIYLWPDFLDRLQSLRNDMKAPLRILSGHRCALHNARVGGAPLSQHLKLAVDINLRGLNLFELRGAAERNGFTGFVFTQHSYTLI